MTACMLSSWYAAAAGLRPRLGGIVVCLVRR